jgi:5-carboxyvanillate decarboxylase
MKRIAIEEHCSIPEHLDLINLILSQKYPVPEVNKAEEYLHYEIKYLPGSRWAMPAGDRIKNGLLDIAEGRLKMMDECGIDMQVLSLVSPGVQAFDTEAASKMARKVNDELAKVTKKYPKRFAAFATIAPQDPKGAAEELKRAVNDLGMKGTSINSHTKGEYLDDVKFWPIFEAAEKLGVPVYIHPRLPGPDIFKPFIPYPGLASSAMGYGVEVDIHSRRLIYSGVFNKYPGLIIIIGHMGESIPYWLWRMDQRWSKSPPDKNVIKKPSEYFKNNFRITTSGMFSQPPFFCALQQITADNILFAVDHPFESSAEAVQFMDEVPLSKSDKEKIYHGNAEKLLKL